jgi:RNA polymerase sigma-70 factor (ECF subfamily)
MSDAHPFERERPRLLALAYRMLGSWSEAEDVVQDAYVRWQGACASVEAPAGWLVRVVTNLCLDTRKSSRARREVYVGPWLPEPVATDGGRLAGEFVDPEEISIAFLALLERLSAAERAVYVLSHAFDFEPREIAEMLGKSEVAVRQLLHRAREHVREGRPRFRASREAHTRMLGAFVTACTTGDLAGLQSLLADDVVALTDGGGKVRAARR